MSKQKQTEETDSPVNVVKIADFLHVREIDRVQDVIPQLRDSILFHAKEIDDIEGEMRHCQKT